MSRVFNAPTYFAGFEGGVAPSIPMSNSVASPRSLRLTGAVAAKDVLSVVTLSWTGQHLRLVPTHSAFFHLRSEDQAGVWQLYREVLGFLTASSIDLLIVRQGPGVGPNAVCTGTTRIDTILQLMPVTCVQPHTQRVIAWLNSDDWLLPLPQSGLPAKRRKHQNRAIETAAFGIAKVLEACSAQILESQTPTELGAFIDEA